MSKQVLAELLVAVVFCFTAYTQNVTKPFPELSREQRQSLTRRLNEYVQAYRDRNWKVLYDFVSDTGKGRANRETFVAAMEVEHGEAYAGMPDLLWFDPARSEENRDGIDIFGCGKARREGEIYTGIAVVHAVREHNSWSFTGWTFTEFPNEPCKLLSDPAWKPARRMDWVKPMEEIRDRDASQQ